MTEPSQSQTGAHNKPVESLIVDTDLCLDILKISDAEELFALVEKNREYLRKTLPWLDEVKVWMNRFHTSFIVTLTMSSERGSCTQSETEEE